MSAPVVYLLRHGQTGWDAAGPPQGQADTPLRALGRAQAEANRRSLAWASSRAPIASILS